MIFLVSTPMLMLILAGISVAEALQHLTEADALQPVLFQIDSKYFIKLDNQAYPLVVPLCFSDCVELLFCTFYVFIENYYNVYNQTHTVENF